MSPPLAAVLRAAPALAAALALVGGCSEPARWRFDTNDGAGTCILAHDNHCLGASCAC